MMVASKSETVLGIDLGTRKSGVCWICGNSVESLKTVKTSHLIDALDKGSKNYGVPAVVVVDAPIDPTAVSGFRIIDRVFMRGKFNNNHVGLQPNNPDLLDLLDEIASLKVWCGHLGIHYSNEFEGLARGILRETMPNPAFGVLCPPDQLLSLKRRLRFRYGRGRNIAPIIVAFECLSSLGSQFFSPIQNLPQNWCDLEQVVGTLTGEQSDDLIAAMVCAALGWWSANTDEVSFVRENRGHYLLPPARLIHTDWRIELADILRSQDFRDVRTNLTPALASPIH